MVYHVKFLSIGRKYWGRTLVLCKFPKSGEVPSSQKNTLFYIFIFDRDKQGEGKPI